MLVIILLVRLSICVVREVSILSCVLQRSTKEWLQEDEEGRDTING